MIDQANGNQYPKPVKLETAKCLSICGAGPNPMVYPAGPAFNQVDEATLWHIVHEHVLSALDEDDSDQIM